MEPLNLQSAIENYDNGENLIDNRAFDFEKEDDTKKVKHKTEYIYTYRHLYSPFGI